MDFRDIEEKTGKKFTEEQKGKINAIIQAISSANEAARRGEKIDIDSVFKDISGNKDES